MSIEKQEILSPFITGTMQLIIKNMQLDNAYYFRTSASPFSLNSINRIYKLLLTVQNFKESVNWKPILTLFYICTQIIFIYLTSIPFTFNWLYNRNTFIRNAFKHGLYSYKYWLNKYVSLSYFSYEIFCISFSATVTMW